TARGAGGEKRSDQRNKECEESPPLESVDTKSFHARSFREIREAPRVPTNSLFQIHVETHGASREHDVGLAAHGQGRSIVGTFHHHAFSSRGPSGLEEFRRVEILAHELAKELHLL